MRGEFNLILLGVFVLFNAGNLDSLRDIFVDSGEGDDARLINGFAGDDASWGDSGLGGDDEGRGGDGLVDDRWGDNGFAVEDDRWGDNAGWGDDANGGGHSRSSDSPAFWLFRKFNASGSPGI